MPVQIKKVAQKTKGRLHVTPYTGIGCLNRRLLYVEHIAFF